MTGLHRTPLTTSQKIECVAKALVGQEASSGIAGLSREYEVSRPTVLRPRGRLRRYYASPLRSPNPILRCG